MQENVNLIQKDGSAKTVRTSRKKDEGVRAVNLVSDTVSQEVARSTVRHNALLLWYTFSASCAVVLLVSIGLTLYGMYMQQQLGSISSTLASTNAQIATIEREAKNLSSFQNRLGKVRTLLENHVYWSQFIDALEKITLPSVSYDNLSVSTQGTLTLSASARNYATVARQLIAFQNANHLATSVHVNGATAQVNQLGDTIGAKFTITFVLNQNLLKKK
jgi:Tfp pilus assembly protein PilN